MNTAKLIYQELQFLPASLQAEVLDFIGYLKARHIGDASGGNCQEKLAELETAFAPYRKSLQTYKFSREEANER